MEEKMEYHIKLSSYNDWHFFRQTPGKTGKWDNFQFHYWENIPECDYWVVFDALPAPENVICPVSNTILITAEPPFITSYNPKFLSQFAMVISCQKLDHPNVLQPAGLLWMVDKDYDTLKNIGEPKKDRLLSIVTSNKWGHRLDLVYKLKDYFGNDIDLFGRGIHEITDKWEGISRYKYHVVLENSAYPHYWTEKLSDAFLGFAYPFYYGDPNLTDYFPVDSFTAVDIRNVEASIRSIEKAISENYYEQRKKQLLLSRNLVLDQYNLFPFIVDLCSKMPAAKEKIPITLYPEVCFLR